MARKETTNTWSDGLIMDLNPINTPKTVLTDCLNGTIITYNGNEHSLQNDMGNYALKNCALNPGFIPIGMKEYGGVLYIVSYNKSNNNVEIGSYPSPSKIETAKDEEDSSGFQFDEITLKGLYEDLKKSYNKTIVFPKVILNPGDEYRIARTNSDILGMKPWFYSEWGIIDNNNNFHKVSVKTVNKNIIDGEVKYVDDQGNDAANYNRANWKISGNLAYKQELINIENVVVIPTSIPYKENDNIIHINLKISFTVNKKYFNESKPDSNLFKCEVLGKDCGIPTIIELNNNNYKVIFTIEDEDGFITNDNSITITPKIYKEENEGEKNVIVDISYPEIKYTVNSDLAISVNDIKFGNTLWTYYVTDDEFTLNFDTIGFKNTITKLNYTLKFNAKDIDGNIIELVPKDFEWNKLGNSTAHFNWENNKFEKENIYDLVITVSRNGIESTNEHILITSKLFNNLDSKRYDLVYFDEWFGQYANQIKDSSISLNSWTITPSNDISVTKNKYLTQWEKDSAYNNYPRFIEKQRFNSIKDNELYCNISIPVNTTYSIKTDLKLPTGALWNATNESAKLIINGIEHSCNESIISGLETSSSYINKIKFSIDDLSREMQKILSYTVNDSLNYESDTGMYYSWAKLIEANPKEQTAKIVISNQPWNQTVDIENWYRNYRIQPTSTINNFKNALKKYNALFVHVAIVSQVGVDANKYISVDLYQDKSSTNALHILGKNSKSQGFVGPAYFAVFNWNDKLQFVPIIGQDGNIIVGEDGLNTAFELFKQMCKHIKYVKTENDAAEGGFITLKTSENLDDKTVNVKVSSEIRTYDFKFGTYNLLMSEDRKAIKDRLNENIITNNFNSNKDINIPKINLNDIDSNIIFTLDNTLKSNLESKKSEVINTIQDLNNQSIIQKGRFSSDEYLNLEEGASEFKENAETPSKELLDIINILNGAERNLSPYYVYFNIKNNPSAASGDSYIMATIPLGYCNDDITIKSTI